MQGHSVLCDCNYRRCQGRERFATIIGRNVFDGAIPSCRRLPAHHPVCRCLKAQEASLRIVAKPNTDIFSVTPSMPLFELSHTFNEVST